jgi:hypothetical protein
MLPCIATLLCRASSLDDEIIYYDINIYYTGPLPLALNSYFIGIDIFIYSIYPVYFDVAFYSNTPIAKEI